MVIEVLLLLVLMLMMMLRVLPILLLKLLLLRSVRGVVLLRRNEGLAVGCHAHHHRNRSGGTQLHALLLHLVQRLRLRVAQDGRDNAGRVERRRGLLRMHEELGSTQLRRAEISRGKGRCSSTE